MWEAGADAELRAADVTGSSCSSECCVLSLPPAPSSLCERRQQGKVSQSRGLMLPAGRARESPAGGARAEESCSPSPSELASALGL